MTLSLPTFMPRPDAGVLQKRGADQILAARDDPGRRAAEKLVRAVDRDRRSVREKFVEVVFGGGVHDHRHVSRVADPAELFQCDLSVLHRVV
jgi:hypothetical protein